MRGKAAVGDEESVSRHDRVEFAHQAAHRDGRLVRCVATLHALAPCRHFCRNFVRVIRLSRMKRFGFGAKRIHQCGERFARIAPQSEIRSRSASNLFGNNVDVYDALAFGRHREPLGRDLAELASDDEQ